MRSDFEELSGNGSEREVTRGADVLPELKNVVLRKTEDLKESHVCFGCNQKSHRVITDLSLFL